MRPRLRSAHLNPTIRRACETEQMQHPVNGAGLERFVGHAIRANDRTKQKIDDEFQSRECQRPIRGQVVACPTAVPQALTVQIHIEKAVDRQTKEKKATTFSA